MTKPKTAHTSQSGSAPADTQESGLSTAARIFWMLIGNAVLLFLSIGMYQNKAFFTSRDTIYWIMVPLLIIVRYCDIRYLGGRTAQGQRASIAHWRKYALFLLVISAALWLLAHGLAFLAK